VYIHSVYIE